MTTHGTNIVTSYLTEEWNLSFVLYFSPFFLTYNKPKITQWYAGQVGVLDLTVACQPNEKIRLLVSKGGLTIEC